MKTTNPVVWFEIYVQDIEKATKFYEEVLGVKLFSIPDPSNQNLKMNVFEMDNDGIGASGALVQMEGCSSGGNSTIVYFISQDCAIEESRVEAAGGKIFKSKMSIGEFGFISLCIDVDGNMFGLHSLK